MIRLLSHEKCPPEEFWFPKEGTGRNFASTPLIHKLAAQVANFRTANGLPGANVEQALIDIDAFTCARLNNNPRWCFDTDTPIPMPSHGGGCATCGAKIK